MKKLFTLFLIIALLGFWNPVYAVWIAEESFDSYTNGNDINGATGGSGWAAVTGWVNTGSNSIKAANDQSVDTPNSAKSASGFTTDNRYYRALAVPVGTDSTMYFSIRTSDVSKNQEQMFALIQGAPFSDYAVKFRINQSNLQYYNQSAWTTIQGVSNDTWYRIGVEVDPVGNANKFQYNINGGAWSGWVTGYANFTAVSGVAIGVEGTGGVATPNIWWDFISASSGAAATPVLTPLSNLVKSFCLN